VNKTDTLEKTSEETIQQSSIILWNDEVNSFDWVIDCLVRVLGQNKLQAEQCAYMVHHKGKCDVKRGWYEELEPYSQKLKDLGLTTTIE
jgi:ATP-dependent Clp protease adaptor protein ClpS